MKSKSELRQELIEKRRALSKKRREEGSQAAIAKLTERLSAFPIVLSFASQKNEIDLWPLNEQLASEGRLALIKTCKQGKLRPFRVNNIQVQLRWRHDWNLLEPIPERCEPVSPENVSLILVPGLGFMLDSGYRLGHGQGYYDRFLPKLGCPRWGVCFMEQLIHEPFQPELHDIPVDEIVTG